MNVSGVVLAGGRSRRMGTDKALLDVGGVPLIQRVAERLASISAEVLIVTNASEAYAFLGYRMVSDRFEGAGALAGLHAGLAAAAHPWALVVACDMPFLNPDLLRLLVNLAPGYDVVVPALRDLAEPLHACYAPARCVPAIERSIQAGERRLISFFPQVAVRTVSEAEIDGIDPAHLSFRNLNTPREWQDAQALLHHPT